MDVEAPRAAMPIESEQTTLVQVEPTGLEPTAQDSIEPTNPEITTPEVTATTETPMITTEIAKIAAVTIACVIDIVAPAYHCENDIDLNSFSHFFFSLNY